MDISTTLLFAGVTAQPTSQHMVNGGMGGLWMGMHWGWWLITVLVLILLIALLLQVVGRGRGDS